MAKVVIDLRECNSKEEVDNAISTGVRKFKNLVQKEGILEELKKREYFMSKSDKRKLKSKLANRRNKKK